MYLELKLNNSFGFYATTKNNIILINNRLFQPINKIL